MLVYLEYTLWKMHQFGISRVFGEYPTVAFQRCHESTALANSDPTAAAGFDRQELSWWGDHKVAELQHEYFSMERCPKLAIDSELFRALYLINQRSFKIRPTNGCRNLCFWSLILQPNAFFRFHISLSFASYLQKREVFTGLPWRHAPPRNHSPRHQQKYHLPQKKTDIPCGTD